MTTLEGQIALITAAGRGVGRALAWALAAQGARVAAHDLTPINLEVTLEYIAQQGGQAKEYLGDLGKRMAAQAVVGQVVSDWGRIDLLVNAMMVRPHASLLEMDEWDWRHTLDVNLNSAFFLTQLVGETMRQQGRGLIVHLVAQESHPAAESGGRSGWGAFRVSQQAVLELARVAAEELAPFNVRVHAFCLPWESALPSGEDTSLTQAAAMAVLEVCRNRSRDTVLSLL